MQTDVQPQSSEKQFVRRVGIALGLTLTAVLLLGLLGAAFDVLLLVLAATLIALPLRAGARWLSARTRWPEGVSLALVALLTLAILVGMGWLISSSIGGQIDQLQEKAPEILEKIEGNLRQTSLGRRLLGQDLTPEKLLEGGGSSRWLGRVSGALSATLGSLADLYVVLFLAAFLAAQPNLYRGGLVMLIPKPGRQRAGQVLDKLGETLLGWLGGKMFSMGVVGILSYLGLWALGIQLAGALALFAGLVAFIPNFGPLLALVPAVGMALLSGPQEALSVLLLYMAIQFVESNLVTPLIQNKVISMPPAMVFVSQLVIGIFAGGLGLAMATPVVAIVMVLVKMLYVQDVLKDDSVKV